MSDRINEKRKKQAISNLNLSNTLLALPNIPTLAFPMRGFGKETDAALPQALESVTRQISVAEAINELPLGHDIRQIPLHSQDRFGNHLGKSRQLAATTAVQQKITPEPQQREILQVQSVSDSGGQKKPIMRDGSDIPGGAIIEAVEGTDSSSIIDKLRQLARQSAGSMADNADFDRQVKPQLMGAIANSLSPRSFPINFIEESGLNMQWTGTISFKIGEPKEDIGGGDASVKRNFGGSGTVTNQATNATTDSGSVTGGVKSGDAKEGGETSGGATIGTSTTRTDQTTNSVTTSGGGDATMSNRLKRYTAPIIVEISVEGSPDFSGSDYINPFKWGFAGAGNLVRGGRKSGQVKSGSVKYYSSTGISAPAVSGAVQRQGWIEHELGITEQSKANFGTAITAYSANPVQFSNSGSTALPQHIAFAAEQHHGVGLDRVRLVHGGQADNYCNSMSATAFATPDNQGETNIFMHSQLPVDSPQGQHTLLHEVSHAVQQIRGETNGLDGLGGDQSRRDLLEKSADFHADAILSNGKGDRDPL